MDQEVNNGSLGKKLIVPLVAVALFAVLVFGATYAYFTANITTTNVGNLNTALENSSTVFTTEGSTCSMLIYASDMVETNVSSAAKNNTTCTLDVKLTGTANVSCNYTLQLVETSTNQYTPSLLDAGGTGTEFTVAITPGENPEDGADLFTMTETQGTNVSNVLGDTAYDKSYANGVETAITTNAGRIASLKRQNIKVMTTGETTTHHYNIEMKWYNIMGDQDKHSGEKYTFDLKATEVKC